MKKKKGKIILLSILAVICAAVTAIGIFLKIKQDQNVYFDRTTINGIECGGKSTEEAYNILLQKYLDAVVEIDENGKVEAEGSLADFGYEIETDQLLRYLEKAMEAQRNGVFVTLNSLIDGTAYVFDVPFTVDEVRLSEAASRENLADERTSSEDARLVFDEQSRSYSIVPEVYGNDFSDEELKTLVQESIDTFTKEKQSGETVVIEIPAEIYIKPSVVSTDENLSREENIYNRFCGAEVNYQFGSQIQTLGWDTIKDWIDISGDQGTLSEEKVREYVVQLEADYNTRYHTRSFHTSLGTDITFPDYSNEYGYTIDESAEISRLIEDISSNTSVTREPVYYTVSEEYQNPLYYRREGKDDLAGTYVEVNLSAQHLWFYKNGALVVESDLVSGCVAKGTETQTGVFPLAYKESPSVLTGDNAEDSYSTPVQYWMPFYSGQGLHDASWRGAFGGSIYISSGSHGCVNLPTAAAAAIYNEIDAGTAILIYK